MNSENKLDGASNSRAWKTRIELILAKNKVLDIMKGNIVKPRKEYPTFEELWTCCAQEESRISAKEKPQKKYDDQEFIARFKNFRNKRKFGSRKKPNQEKDMSEIQCFNY
jgi:hypothetical protein